MAAASLFVLDLRTAPRSIAERLQMPREEFGMPPLNTIGIGKSYDAILYSRGVTRAVPCPAGSVP